MSAHNSIVLTAAPAGRFLEGLIATGTTPKPGTMMMLEAGVEMQSGKFFWTPFTDVDGATGLVAILLENWFLGKGPTDAYAAEEQCRLYCPIPGDEIQVLLQNQSGTDDAFAIGDKLMVDSGTGKFLASVYNEAEPFIVAETLAGLTADTLCHSFFTGY